LPIWIDFLVSAAIIIIAFELGFNLGKWQRTRQVGDNKIRLGPLVAATLGLLAFMIALTFNSVSSHYDIRKQLVLDEANAVGTAYARTQILDEADKVEAQRLLHDYVTLRVETRQYGTTRQAMQEGIDKSEAIQDELWARAIVIAGQNPTPITALYLQSLNTLMDRHQERVTVNIHHRMPAIFWAALYGLAALAMVVGGYDAGVSGGGRSIISILAVVIAFSMMLILLVALDRPRQRLSEVNQAALIDVQQDIRRSMQSQR
jgi:hypothetical protein